MFAERIANGKSIVILEISDVDLLRLGILHVLDGSEGDLSSPIRVRASAHSVTAEGPVRGLKRSDLTVKRYAIFSKPTLKLIDP